VIKLVAAGYDTISHPLFPCAENRAKAETGCRVKVQFERHRVGLRSVFGVVMDLLSSLGVVKRYSALICPPGTKHGNSLPVYELDLDDVKADEAINRIAEILKDCIAQETIQAVTKE
jgi:hypothetical protein